MYVPVRRPATQLDFQKATPHDLQHTCARLAVSDGVNLLTRMLEHKDPSVTLWVYADLFETDQDVVAASLCAKYSPQRYGHSSLG